MALVTTFSDRAAVEARTPEQRAIAAAKDRAVMLAVKYDVEPVTYTSKLGYCYLAEARRQRAGVMTTYRNETAIINAYNKDA